MKLGEVKLSMNCLISEDSLKVEFQVQMLDPIGLYLKLVIGVIHVVQHIVV